MPMPSLFADYMQKYGGALTAVSNPTRVHGVINRSPQMANNVQPQPALAQTQPPSTMPSAFSTPGAAPAPQGVHLNEIVSTGRREPAPQQQQPMGRPGQTPAPAATPATQVSFEDVWKELPDEEKEKATSQLEQQLGDIDEAYGALVEKMGERPDDKLTRQEKGGLLMEFGLHLMAASGARRHGEDIGAAIGDAGINAVESFKQLKYEKRANQAIHDRTMTAITSAHQSARQAAKEEDRTSRKTDAEINKLEAETEKLQREATGRGVGTLRWIVHDDADGNSYAINPEDPQNRVRLGKNPPGKGADGQRPFEFQTKFDYYMSVHGVDANGEELPQDKLKEVSAQALDFANRTTGWSEGEAYKFAREEAGKAADRGSIDPTPEAIRAEEEKIMARMGFGPKAQPPSGRTALTNDFDEFGEEDVTDQVPPELLNQLQEGVKQVNSAGQILVRRGNRIYFLGQK